MNAAAVAEARKLTTVMPWSQELADDSATPDLARYARVTMRWLAAGISGRLVNRGGGWYKLDGNTVRGHATVWAMLDAETAP